MHKCEVIQIRKNVLYGNDVPLKTLLKDDGKESLFFFTIRHKSNTAWIKHVGIGKLIGTNIAVTINRIRQKLILYLTDMPTGA